MRSVWSSFLSTPLGELLTGSAYLSDPTDLTAPLGLRFAGQSVLGVHVALDKAATVRITFGQGAVPKLSGIRNINRRDSAGFSQLLRAEAAATGARWAVVVLATGWQAVLGHRAARPEPGEPASMFSRHKLMFETPELIYPRAQPDRVYTAVDHPVLDRSVVFSVRRAELDELFGQIHMSGLGVASVKITIAAQLELWLGMNAENGLARDVLITDGLGALLVNAEQGDFAAPRDSLDAQQPRQSVQRPSAIDEDMIRFLAANGTRAVTYLGPQESFDAIQRRFPQHDIVRPAETAAHDIHTVALCSAAQHDLNFAAREARPAVAKKWRRLVVAYFAVGLLLAGIAAVNAGYALRVGYRAYQLEKESARTGGETQVDKAAAARIADEFEGTLALQAWVAGNFHAQQFCYALLKDVPANAAIDKLVVEMAGGQITATVVVVGDEGAQLKTRRAVENAIKKLHYNIGAEEHPVSVGSGGNAVQYRIHILVPDAALASAS